MKTIELKIYSFNELSENAKQKAIKDFSEDYSREFYLDYEWYDGVYEDFKTICSILGIEIDRIYFSGFWSQGDGACFVGEFEYKKGMLKNLINYAPKDEELHQIAKNIFEVQKLNFYQLRGSTVHRGMYYHYNSIDVNIERNDYKEAVNSEVFEDSIRGLCKWLYDSLESSYEDLMSDNLITEHLIANDYEFLETGERY